MTGFIYFGKESVNARDIIGDYAGLAAASPGH